jgi:hypothetical protein
LTAIKAVEAFMHEHWALLGIEAQRFAKPSNLPSLAEVLLQFLLAHVETLTQQVADERLKRIVAEQARTLSLLGRSSEQELREDKLRIALAESQVAAEQAEQQRDAAHAALRKWGHHSANCDAIKKLVKRVEWSVDPVTDEPEPSYHYDTHKGDCTCGLDAALTASAPQKE